MPRCSTCSSWSSCSSSRSSLTSSAARICPAARPAGSSCSSSSTVPRRPHHTASPARRTPSRTSVSWLRQRPPRHAGGRLGAGRHLQGPGAAGQERHHAGRVRGHQGQGARPVARCAIRVVSECYGNRKCKKKVPDRGGSSVCRRASSSEVQACIATSASAFQAGPARHVREVDAPRPTQAARTARGTRGLRAAPPVARRSTRRRALRV